MTYTSEEKMNIINRMNRGDSIRALCAEYGISRSTLYRWAGDYSKPDSDSGKNHIPTVKDYNTLQRKVEKLENIITIDNNCDSHFSITCSIQAYIVIIQIVARPSKCRNRCGCHYQQYHQKR